MNRVIKNASWIIVCRVVQSVLGMVVSMISARYLGPSNFGLLNYAISVVAFVIPVMKLGISSVLVQEFVNNPEKEGETLGTSIVLNLLSGVVCIVGANLFVMIANAGERDTIAVCALYSSILIFQAFEVINYWFQAKLLAKISSIIAFIAYSAVSAYKLYLLITHKSIYWFSVANTLDFLLIAIGLMCAYKRMGTQKLGFSWKRARKLVSVGKYYIIADLMVTVFAQTDRIMLKSMIDNAASGYYSAAINCAAMTQFIFVAIIDSMRPIIYEAKNESEEAFELNMSRLFSLVIYLSLIQSGAMTVFAPLIVRFLYGGAYSATVSALQIVVWYTTFSYLGGARNIWILAQDKQKYLWQINLCGALANVGLNALLIPIMGVNGAAVASLATQFFTNVVTGYIFRPISGINALLKRGFDPRFFVENVRLVIDMLRKRAA